MVHILVFDSGVGGLSVSAEIRTRLPHARQSYVADDVYRPYGEKTEAQLNERLPALLRSLELMLSPDVIVIACNTASTTALPVVRDAVTVPVVGVVPAIKPAAQNSLTKVIGVLGTPGTVKRRYVDRLIEEFASDCRVVLHGSTPLVEMAEAKLAGKSPDLQDLSREIRPLFDQAGSDQIDHIVLACTHFPLLKEDLSKVVAYPVSWIDSGQAIARRVDNLLDDTNPKNYDIGSGDIVFIIGNTPTVEVVKSFASFGFAKCVMLPD